MNEHIGTITPAGRMVMQIVGSFAEFERAMIHERTRVVLKLSMFKAVLMADARN